MSDNDADVRRAVLDGHEFDRQRLEPALVPLLAGDDHGQVWVLESDGALADGDLSGGVASGSLTGYAVVTWSWSLESGGRDCILDEIYVRTPSQGSGSRLLAAALEGAAACGARAVFLETEAPNERARTFYARNGFVQEDSVWMSRTLDR